MVGGAGYIGSHMVKYLLKHGHKPVVLDNLSTGCERLIQNTPFYKGSMSDEPLLDKIFTEQSIEAVMHFAAFSQVAESQLKPSVYYENNVANTIKLLNAMVRYSINYFIFSSTAAVFGNPNYSPIDEAHEKTPINVYGKTKLMIEQLLEDYAEAHGLISCCLRYFNAAGADAEGKLGECHEPETHLIPICLEVALGKREKLHINGNDYDTADGTCVRDYIHVEDLAQAHLLALEHIMKTQCSETFNLGNGSGYSVAEVVQAVEKVTGQKLKVEMAERRPGDPAVLVANSDKIKHLLDWKTKHPELETIIQHAWNWSQTN